MVPGLLHKYRNRALLLVKGGCAVNCRYCFRRHFPYAENQGTRRNWQTAMDYIAAHPQLDEIIFSGGDPLMAKDHELDWLMTQLEAIPHVKRLRIHSRLPIVIPARITETLASRFQRSSLQVIPLTTLTTPMKLTVSFARRCHAASGGRHAAQPERAAARGERQRANPGRPQQCAV